MNEVLKFTYTFITCLCLKFLSYTLGCLIEWGNGDGGGGGGAPFYFLNFFLSPPSPRTLLRPPRLLILPLKFDTNPQTPF